MATKLEGRGGEGGICLSGRATIKKKFAASLTEGQNKECWIRFSFLFTGPKLRIGHGTSSIWHCARVEKYVFFKSHL